MITNSCYQNARNYHLHFKMKWTWHRNTYKLYNSNIVIKFYNSKFITYDLINNKNNDATLTNISQHPHSQKYMIITKLKVVNWVLNFKENISWIFHEQVWSLTGQKIFQDQEWLLLQWMECLVQLKDKIIYFTYNAYLKQSFITFF